MLKTAKYLNSTKKPLALIAPLDWGLGHTTRCIPIIRELKKNNIEIVIACNSVQKSVLEAEFPDETYVNLPGYGLSYGSSRRHTIAKLILQIPKILISIKKENLQLKRFLLQFNANIIISDNRYGIFSRNIHSIFITHQLNIVTGTGHFGDRLIRRFTHSMIRKFDECWVPDFENGFTLAGRLSHPVLKPAFPVRYIGPLSRFERCAGPGNGLHSSTANGVHSSAGTQSYILVILSGPEPQRSKLEEIMLAQLAMVDSDSIVIRGLPHNAESISASSKMRMINFAGAAELNKLICNAYVVISRSGYTTVMDLLKLQKKAILIPTPGQPEQEYLGRYLSRLQLAVVANQETLNLREELTKIDSLKVPKELSMEGYKEFCSADVLVRCTTDLPIR